MSTITKERLEPVIERLEHYATNVKWTNVQAAQDMLTAADAMRRLLASIEAEPVAFRSKLKPPYAGSERWDYTDHRQPDAFELENCFIERLYTAPPAPVSVPDERPSLNNGIVGFDEGWNACRDAMLQGAENAESRCSNSSVVPDCSCRTCRPVTFSDSRFVVCPDCGNKRCPHANDHRNACTGSNEPGQEGSAYPAAPQQEVK